MYGSGNLRLKQGTLFDGVDQPLGQHGTFQPNRDEIVHRWYPYLEGFSNTFVRTLIGEFGGGRHLSIYEPFAGSGTTPCVAAADGHSCTYSEINPYMRLVIWAKTAGIGLLKSRPDEFRRLVAETIALAKSTIPSSDEAAIEIARVFPGRPYFDVRRGPEMVSLRRAILAVQGEMGDLLKFMLGAISVESSELKRAGDLRYRTAKEKIAASYSAYDRFQQLSETIYWDASELTPPEGRVSVLTESALTQAPAADFADLIITSPPYINGTNYIRNAKLELWAAGLITGEADLRPLRDSAVTSGICDVTKKGRDIVQVRGLDPVISQLVESAYDRRIPEMVRMYFSDASIWISNARRYLRRGGHLIIDIGDSRFGGVHVPADLLLASIAMDSGFNLLESRYVRARRSKDGTPLKQVLLILKAA